MLYIGTGKSVVNFECQLCYLLQNKLADLQNTAILRSPHMPLWKLQGNNEYQHREVTYR